MFSTAIVPDSCVREANNSSNSDEILSLRLADSRATANEFRRDEGVNNGEGSVEVGDMDGEEWRMSSSVSDNTSDDAFRNGEGERDRSVSSPESVKLRPLAAIDPS